MAPTPTHPKVVELIGLCQDHYSIRTEDSQVVFTCKWCNAGFVIARTRKPTLRNASGLIGHVLSHDRNANTPDHSE